MNIYREILFKLWKRQDHPYIFYKVTTRNVFMLRGSIKEVDPIANRLNQEQGIELTKVPLRGATLTEYVYCITDSFDEMMTSRMIEPDPMKQYTVAQEGT